jgi:hypothetical protein
MDDHPPTARFFTGNWNTNLRKSAQSVDKKDVIHRLHRFSQITEPPIESLAEREQ